MDPTTDDLVANSVAESDSGCSDDERTSTSSDEWIRKDADTVSSKKRIASFESLPDPEKHGHLLRRCVDEILTQAVFKGTSRTSKVLEWCEPDRLAEKIDLTLRDGPESDEELVRILRDIIKHSVKTGHPYFANQLFSSVDPYGLIGQWLTDALNPSVYTFEVSPVFTLMEEQVLEEMRRIVGFADGDGIFCPGGSMANAYAISCARFKFMPDIKVCGLSGLPRLVLFTSEDAHYSIKKMAAFLGLGERNVFLIETDSRGKMCPIDLEKQIKLATAEGGVPFMVSATAGTTVLGAFDPLPEIADICQKYKIWMHVDAAWGGGALMSRKYRQLLTGIERADSVTWNPHKLLAAPQQCSTFLVKHKGLLSGCHSASASYLFQKDKFYDTKFDTGDKHVQCGRRADVLKFWFMWKAKGTSGLEKHIDKVFGISEYFTKEIKERPGFRMVLPEPECTNVCFWYVPESLRNLDPSSADYNKRLNSVAPKIKERMMKEGSMMVTYQPHKDKPNFFRIVFQNSGLEKSDVFHIVQTFEKLGKDL